ncbi:MAG: hypothetical protein WAW86_05150 [Gammaproteobacteria bacterium]
MNGRILFGLLLTTAISANSFALEISKGKLLSHKEIANGKIQGSFLSIKSDSALTKRFSKYKEHTSHVSAYVNAFQNDGIAGSDITFKGRSTIWVWNQTSQTQTYTINQTGTVCFYGNTNMCIPETIESIDVISLAPGGFISESNLPKITTNYDTAGHGIFEIIINVSVDGSVHEFETSNRAEFTISESDK